MKKLPITRVILVTFLFASSPGFSQRPQSAADAELLIRKTKKTGVIHEDNAGLSTSVPSLRRPDLKAVTGRVVMPVKNTEQKIFIDNLSVLDPSVIGNINYNPSATADYCTNPAVRQGCCYYWINNTQSSVNELYAAPDGVFPDETASRNYYLSLKPQIPFYWPYHESSVYPGGGWYYSNGSGHGSVDFSKTAESYGPGIDPTFDVQAAADGKVVSTGWVDLFGNYIILEHKAPDGTIYRTGYFHLRNGFDHDLQKAKNVKVTSGDPKERDSLYVKYAHFPNPTSQQWGTNAQKIKVSTGDQVYAGQQLAFAGNTGYGGAGWGLDPATAKPYDPNTANNHLHFMLWIKSPANSNSISWLEIDALGLYAAITDANRGCIDVGANKAFKRFFAPHYPSFHNIPFEYLLTGFNYYTGMGMTLQTLSVHRSGNKFSTSGSFRNGGSGEWYCRTLMNSSQYQQYFNEYSGKGFIPREISVTKDNNGSPLFTAIWRKLKAGEVAVAYHNLDDAGWNAAWAKHTVTEKKSCTEHVHYYVNGKSYHAAVFSSVSNGFYVYTNMSMADFQKKFDDLAKAGYMPTNITAEENGAVTTFGGVWVPKNNTAYNAFAELSAQGYQDKFNEMSAQGYQLLRVMGYANSTKFIGIWTK